MKVLLFWYLMYLYPRFIRLCRCSFGSQCICTTLIFAVADALLEAAVSAMPWYSLVQMLFFRLVHLRLVFLWTCRCFLHCLSCTIASSTCPFYTLQILPTEFLHPQSALATPCRYSQLNFCILTSRKSTIADIVAQYSLSPIYSMACADTFLTKKLI